MLCLVTGATRPFGVFEIKKATLNNETKTKVIHDKVTTDNKNVNKYFIFKYTQIFT